MVLMAGGGKKNFLGNFRDEELVFVFEFWWKVVVWL